MRPFIFNGLADLDSTWAVTKQLLLGAALPYVVMTDPIIQRIEAFQCSRGRLFAERRNRGYTLYHARSDAPVARLRPAGSEGRFQVLYWSLWKERWASTGPFGRTILAIDDALPFIAHEDIFWVMT